MPIYKNTSVSAKTFYGISIQPRETKRFPRRVNDTKMIIVESLPKEPPAAIKPVPDKKEPKPAAADKRDSRPSVSEQPNDNKNIEEVNSNGTD